MSTTEQDNIETLRSERDEMRANLIECKEIIAAICSGKVDVVLKNGIDRLHIAPPEQSLETYRLLIENIEQGTATLSADGIILYANKTLAGMLSISHGRLIGSRVYDLISSDYHNELASWFGKHCGNRRSGEWVLVTSDGDEKVVHAAMSPLPANTGAAYALLVTDIGPSLEREALRRDKLHLEREAIELTVAKLEAEQASHAKSNFLSTMSHELRTPLNAIMGFTELLLMTEEKASRRDQLATVLDAGRGLLDLISNILDFSKIEAGKFDVSEDDFVIADMLAHLMSMFEVMASSKSIKFVSLIDPSVPAIIRGDAGLLRQILNNLIGNSIKFTKYGSISFHLSCELSLPDTATLMFSVTDTGIGIRPENIDRIFEVFEQEDSSLTRRFGGTGLGLSITKKLVALMGGNLGVESEFGRGSRFWVTLPFKIASNSVHSGSHSNIATAPDTRTASFRILVAEDNRINQMLMRSMLEKLGHTVRVVENGRQALDAVISDDFDVVLMDILMPEMDGEESTRAIRALHSPKRNVPVIALTADVLLEHRERYILCGMNDVLAKPIDWRALSDALGLLAKIRITS